MILNRIDNIPHGTEILVDTNIIIYAAVAHQIFGSPSKRLLKRREIGEIKGVIPTVVMNEVLYRFMIVELIEKDVGKNVREVLGTVKKNPGILSLLSKTWENIDYLFHINCTIASEQEDTFFKSVNIARDYNLLATDAYVAAFAMSYKISHIASNDADFMKVPWLTVRCPQVDGM